MKNGADAQNADARAMKSLRRLGWSKSIGIDITGALSRLRIRGDGVPTLSSFLMGQDIDGEKQWLLDSPDHQYQVVVDPRCLKSFRSRFMAPP